MALLSAVLGAVAEIWVGRLSHSRGMNFAPAGFQSITQFGVGG
jgi:hypothetical protein